jgi:HPr kinase/phosphorylase
LSRKDEKFSITVKTLFLDNKKPLKLELVSGKDGLKKKITKKELHRPGLALAGFVDKFTYKRVQICGNTEILYLKKLTPVKRQKALQKVMAFDIPCFIVTDSNEIPGEFAHSSEQHGIPVFRTPFATTQIAQHLGDYLDGKFALRTFIHGSLVDVYGIGVLIAGRSGIGKSEVALDLVARGHRLVVDDVVAIVRRSGGILIGLGNEKLKYHMEIRGLGVVDVRAMFGIRGIRRQKRVEVQLELVDWDNSEKYERLGLKEITTDILGVKIPLVRLPVFPGKNISVIAETIAMNQLLKIYGLDSAREFEKELYRKQIQETLGAKEYLGRDFE